MPGTRCNCFHIAVKSTTFKVRWHGRCAAGLTVQRRRQDLSTAIVQCPLHIHALAACNIMLSSVQPRNGGASQEAECPVDASTTSCHHPRSVANRAHLQLPSSFHSWWVAHVAITSRHSHQRAHRPTRTAVARIPPALEAKVLCAVRRGQVLRSTASAIGTYILPYHRSIRFCREDHRLRSSCRSVARLQSCSFASAPRVDIWCSGALNGELCLMQCSPLQLDLCRQRQAQRAFHTVSLHLPRVPERL